MIGKNWNRCMRMCGQKDKVGNANFKQSGTHYNEVWNFSMVSSIFSIYISSSQRTVVSKSVWLRCYPPLWALVLTTPARFQTSHLHLLPLVAGVAISKMNLLELRVLWVTLACKLRSPNKRLRIQTVSMHTARKWFPTKREALYWTKRHYIRA